VIKEAVQRIVDREWGLDSWSIGNFYFKVNDGPYSIYFDVDHLAIHRHEDPYTHNSGMVGILIHYSDPDLFAKIEELIKEGL